MHACVWVHRGAEKVIETERMGEEREARGKQPQEPTLKEVQFMKFTLSSSEELDSIQQPLQVCQAGPEDESVGRRMSEPATEGEMLTHTYM